MAGEIFDYFAFISYSHEDKETAQKLQKRLERYHMPAKLLQAHPELPKKLSPIFRDESDISGKGTLIETLHDNLRRSQYLILICSPSSAKSVYVNDEVKYFIEELHREDKIIPLIVGGIPRSKDSEIECFPPAILSLDREREPLGIDLKTFGRDGAFLRVIAAMLRLNFTYFKNRDDEERKRRLKIFASVAAMLAVIIGGLVWYSVETFNLMQSNDFMTQYNFGVIYYKKRDYIRAAEWFEKAAANNYFDAQNQLGSMYQQGLGVEKNYAKAMEWYRKAADNGSAAAQNNIGYIYRNGLGVEKDNAKAAEWYRKSAAQGNVSAQLNIGNMYLHGEGVKRDYAKALEWFEKAAANGNSTAQHNIGVMYFYGHGVKQDYAKALEWFEIAASQEYALAQYSIGYMYMDGLGTEKNYAKAIAWYQKAVDNGHVEAQNNIGYMYEHGFGVEKNYAKAMECYQKAADAGVARAQYHIGYMFLHGLGVPKSSDKAIEYFTQAAQQGDNDAKSELQKLSPQDK